MVPAIEVGLRSPGPATRPLSTVRALAQFKRIHRPGPPTVDVEATVEATADARRLVVVTSPGRERGLDVALVVDSSLVMSVCRGELQSSRRCCAGREPSGQSPAGRSCPIRRLTKHRAAGQQVPDQM